MIARLSGRLIVKNPPQIIIDCNGVGYEVWLPMSTFYTLPDINEQIILLTHFVVREDAQLLYGFATQKELNTFKILIKINGVGPKMALAILSGLSVDELMQIVSGQELSRLTRVPGVGKKTAERLLLELKSQAGTTLSNETQNIANSHADILQALIALGYNDKEANSALKNLPTEIGVSEGIKLALRQLN